MIISEAQTQLFTNMHINCRGRIIDFKVPKVMGILNLTPDSFYDGGRFEGEKAVLAQVEKMLKEGADFIDIGGVSSRPGAEVIGAEEELKRVLPRLVNVLREFPQAVVSVDTIHAKVAEECLKVGAHVINDISAGRYDADMLEAVATAGVPYILMHMQGQPTDMQQNPEYGDVVKEVIQFFEGRVDACCKAGIKDLVIDPGFGFGKTVEHNYTLLKHLKEFEKFGVPVLAGVSRKSMICKVLKVNPDKALNGTTAAHMLALLNGANILRVHDVREAVECVAVWEEYRQA